MMKDIIYIVVIAAMLCLWLWTIKKRIKFGETQISTLENHVRIQTNQLCEFRKTVEYATESLNNSIPNHEPKITDSFHYDGKRWYVEDITITINEDKETEDHIVVSGRRARY